MMVFARKSYIVYVDPHHRWELLRVANDLEKVGFHTETMLGKAACLFGTLPSDVEPGDKLKTVHGVTRWEAE